MESETDFVFKQATTDEWQKWMNQWKHNYELEIINSFIHPNTSNLTILLKRTKIK